MRRSSSVWQGEAGAATTSGSLGTTVAPSRVPIRRASAADLADVTRLISLGDERPYALDAVERLVSGFDPHCCLGWLGLDGDRAVGLTMLEVRPMVSGDRRYAGGYWTNLFVLPEYRTSLVYPRLALTMFRGAEEAGIDFVYAATRRKDVAESHLALGMKRIRDIPVLAKPLRPVRLVSKYKRLGYFEPGEENVIDRAYVTYLGWKRRRRLAGIVSEPLDWNSPAVGEPVGLLRSSQLGSMGQAWSEESFRRRFAKALDGGGYCLVGARSGKRLVAGLVYRITERWDQIRSGILMELIGTDTHPEALRQCVRAAEADAIRAGAEVLLCLDDSASSSTFLRKLGYWKSPDTYVLMWRKLSPTSESLCASGNGEWRHSFADHDAF